MPFRNSKFRDLDVKDKNMYFIKNTVFRFKKTSSQIGSFKKKNYQQKHKNYKEKLNKMTNCQKKPQEDKFCTLYQKGDSLKSRV